MHPRDRILAAAIRRFLEESIGSVGINRIVAEADVALLTLYRQFGGKDELIAAAVRRWSAQWLHWLRDQLDGYGDDPDARFEGLWEALAAWLTSKQFRGSLVTCAATELHGSPQHPAHKAITDHRMAVRQLLEELAKLTGAADPAASATRLHIIVEGAIASAIIDRQSVDGPSIRALARAVLADASA